LSSGDRDVAPGKSAIETARNPGRFSKLGRNKSRVPHISRKTSEMWRTRDLLDGLRFIRHRDCNSHAIVEAGNPARKPSLSLYRSEKEDLE
jgi:hypothetical protein